MKRCAVIQMELWLPTSDTVMKMIPFSFCGHEYTYAKFLIILTKG